MDNMFREELILDLKSANGTIKLETLQKFKELGMDKDTMYSVLNSLRDEMRKKGDEKSENDIMDAMDLVVGFCNPKLRLFP